jgi:hypothetical protein
MLQAPLEVTPQLKRTYSATTGSVRACDDLVPLPKITGELILQVYTHKSLRIPGGQNFDEDNERLSDLGLKALEMAVAFSLFRKHPLVSPFTSGCATNRFGVLSAPKLTAEEISVRCHFTGPVLRLTDCPLSGAEGGHFVTSELWPLGVWI